MRYYHYNDTRTYAMYDNEYVYVNIFLWSNHYPILIQVNNEYTYHSKH